MCGVRSCSRSSSCSHSFSHNWSIVKWNTHRNKGKNVHMLIEKPCALIASRYLLHLKLVVIWCVNENAYMYQQIVDSIHVYICDRAHKLIRKLIFGKRKIRENTPDKKKWDTWSNKWTQNSELSEKLWSQLNATAFFSNDYK